MIRSFAQRNLVLFTDPLLEKVDGEAPATEIVGQNVLPERTAVHACATTSAIDERDDTKFAYARSATVTSHTLQTSV